MFLLKKGIYAKYDLRASNGFRKTDFSISSHMNISRKIEFSIFPYKYTRKSTWPFRSQLYFQLRSIIRTNLVVHDAWYLVPRFQTTRKRFHRNFTKYGHGGHFCQQTGTIWTNIRTLNSKGNIKYSYSWPKDFKEEVSENIDNEGKGKGRCIWRDRAGKDRTKKSEPNSIVFLLGANLFLQDF